MASVTNNTLAPARAGVRHTFPAPYEDDPSTMQVGAGTNAAVTASLAADTLARGHILAGLLWSYSGTPTGGNIKVQAGTTPNTYLDLDIAAGGNGQVLLPAPIVLDRTQAATAVLAAGGSGVTGKLKLLTWRLE